MYLLVLLVLVLLPFPVNYVWQEVGRIFAVHVDVAQVVDDPERTSQPWTRCLKHPVFPLGLWCIQYFQVV